ncbi:serine hydrolase [Defluviicoccus vanus]|uniref:serine hydrolase n=1 Tax=Defluviicoccus vanus TaxID=111831 RepID=UPI0021D7BDE8|nr:serine hydrolase [Defluviicoccus vanus]
MRDLTRVLVSAPLRRVFRYAFGTHARILALLCVLTMAGWPALAADGRLASILIDANDGRVLESANADLPRYPASLTKMMTLYLTFEALDDGRFTLDQPLTVSARAAAQAPTKLDCGPAKPLRSNQPCLDW